MTKKDKKLIEDIFLEERECGHTICDFDDKENDLTAIADELGIEYDYNDEDEIIFKTAEEEKRVRECLDYYYELHA